MRLRRTTKDENNTAECRDSAALLGVSPGFGEAGLLVLQSASSALSAVNAFDLLHATCCLRLETIF